MPPPFTPPQGDTGVVQENLAAVRTLRGYQMVKDNANSGLTIQRSVQWSKGDGETELVREKEERGKAKTAGERTEREKSDRGRESEIRAHEED